MAGVPALAANNSFPLSLAAPYGCLQPSLVLDGMAMRSLVLCAVVPRRRQPLLAVDVARCTLPIR
jgi:hypothetical protein